MSSTRADLLSVREPRANWTTSARALVIDVVFQSARPDDVVFDARAHTLNRLTNPELKKTNNRVMWDSLFA